MSLIDTVRTALANWPQPRMKGLGVVVPTQCLFLGGGVVHVMVEGGQHSFRVNDGGGAMIDFENAGGELSNANKIVSTFLRDRGLTVDRDGKICAPEVTAEALPSVIAIVANASRDASAHLMDRWKPVSRRKFKDLVQDLIAYEFPKKWARERAVAGKSNKLHRFDFVVELGGDRQLLIDAVVPDPNSINTAVVRNLDVAEARSEHVLQRILYDDQQPWKASDLNLLKIGAMTVAFSHAGPSLEHLVH